MVETISNKEVKARKEHLCNFCRGKINKGEVYETPTLKYDGDIYTWRNHLKCDKLCSELNMESNGNGITEEDFHDYVDEFLSENMPEDEWDEWQSGGEDSVDKVIEILKEKGKWDEKK